ncbi:BnaAnng32260D [Brassica napus]|uniref:BnaAnng32260D protein n=1 Tax=Brassica napus TaxID=3708 RepID=A0A078JWP5_BRANA|nr:BnaAnng32260D [Brassica napus]
MRGNASLNHQELSSAP